MSVNKKLLAYHMGRLKDKNPEVRLKSIQELEQLGDPEALNVLREVFENDADVEVRKAAQEAGRVIFTRQRANH